MKIFVTGTRGVPDIPGGVERHCQELYPLIAAQGYDVTIATRKAYVEGSDKKWNNIQLIHLYAPRKKSFEAIVHTFLSVLKARLWNADIIHIHGIGPGLMVPLARILGMKVVITNHGPDYDRVKWGKLAKAVLRFGEWVSGRFADHVIVISAIIKETIYIRCSRDCSIIYNGVSSARQSEGRDFLDRIGVTPSKYILAVSRFVPEKGLHLLVEAYKRIDNKGYNLVITGDADHDTDYSRRLKKTIAEDQRIISTGYISGRELNQVFSYAALFVLPSYHEGLPIALLEAMSYGLPVLVSDIPANREVDLPNERFFECGDSQDLTEKMKHLLENNISDTEKNAFQHQIQEKYNWSTIADQTVAVYKKVLGGFNKS